MLVCLFDEAMAISVHNVFLPQATWSPVDFASLGSSEIGVVGAMKCFGPCPATIYWCPWVIELFNCVKLNKF